MKIKLIFNGQLVADVTREDALAGVAALVKQPADAVERQLFSGQSVTVKTVKTQEDAQRFVRVFAKAGIVLDVQTIPAPSADAVTDASSEEVPRKSPLRLVGLAVLALLLIGVTGSAWYLQPVWRANATSAALKSAVAALASDDLVALGYVDAHRAIDLQERLYGDPDSGALILPDEDTWDSLAAAGIVLGDQVDSVLVSLHVEGDRADWSLVALGTPDAGAVHKWILARYDVERTDAQTRTIFFTWVDDKTCEPSGLFAARTGPGWVLVAAADRFDDLWSRLNQGGTPPPLVDTWLSLADEQLLTAGIFNPEAISKSADGMAAMMLTAAGEAASPAEGVYLGISPTLMPPGVNLQGTIESADSTFLDTVESAASTWLETTKISAAEMSPDVASIIDRLFVLRDGENVTAGVRLDTNFSDELGKLLGAVVGQAFQVSMQSSGPAEERIKESPLTFANSSAAQVGDFTQFGNAFFEPQWQQGPFAIGVSGLAADEEGGLLVSLRGEGRGLPNLAERSSLVQFRVTDALDQSGTSILPDQSCGPIRNTQWEDDNHVSMATYFQDTDIVYYPAVSLQKELRFAENTDPADIRTIRGEIEFLLPTQVRTVVVNSPSAADVVEGEDVRISFKAAAENTISYQLSGDRRRLLALRGLNDRGQVLESGSSSRSDVWLGSGQNVSVDFHGAVAAAEVVLAETFEPIRYRFEVPGAYPAIDSDNNATPAGTIEIATADALSAAMEAPAPRVTFEYTQPMATTSTGPALLSVGQMQVSSFMGLTAQMDLYVSNELPLENQLNGASIALDDVHFADGSSQGIGIVLPAALEADGGYWMNGEFQYDENKPWLKGSVYWQDSDFESDMPTAASGRIVYRAVNNTAVVTLSPTPGQRTDEHGVEILVSEWRNNALSMNIVAGADRVISVTAVDADGQPVGRSGSVSASDSEVSVNVDLNAVPAALEVLVALETEEFITPFRIDLDETE